MDKEVLVVAVKALAGGSAVVLFALIGETGRPKSFSGLFAAAPAVAAASLLVTVLVDGTAKAAPYTRGAILGAAGMLACCVVAALVSRTGGTLLASAAGWLAWAAVAIGLYLVVPG